MPSPRGTCHRCGGPTSAARNRLCWACFTTQTTVDDRFWAKVDTSAGLLGCWPWQGARLPSGYGAFKAPAGVVTASRFALGLALGRELTADEFACHTCDNPPCCNPAHLYAGSAADNAHDMVARGRNSAAVHPEAILRGERCGSARLTADTVARIRARRRDGLSFPQLAREFGIALSHAQRIVSGAAWAHTLEGAQA